MRMTDSGHEAAVDPAGRQAQQYSQTVPRLRFPLSHSANGPLPSPRLQVASGQVKVSVADGPRQRRLVAAGPAGRGRPDHGDAQFRRQADGAAGRAVERQDPGARVRRPVLPARRRAPRLRRARTAKGYQLLFANYADQRLYLTGPGTERAGSADARPGHGAGHHRTRHAASRGRGRAAARWPQAACGTPTSSCRRTARKSGACRSGTTAARSAARSSRCRWTDPPPPTPDAIRTLVDGSDFFAFPTPSPDGKWLAWICWNHPHMPWDGTELRVAPVENGVPGKGRLLMGGQRESVLAPLWRDNTSLYVATDWPGWWNIYQLGLRRRAAAGAVPGRRGVRRAAVAARRAAVRAARRRPARGGARRRRRPGSASWIRSRSS